MSMAADQNCNTLLTCLEELTQTDDHRTIGRTLDKCFDSTIKEIFAKWMGNESITDEERHLLDIYSRLQLFFVERCLLNSNPTDEDQEIIHALPEYLFRKKPIKMLDEVVLFIRNDQQVIDQSTDRDSMFIYLMRMLDARAIAYRLCFESLKVKPTALNDELLQCLTHRDTEQYLDAAKSLAENGMSSSWNETLHYRHQFFIGCCTFSVALFEKNHNTFTSQKHKKYIFSLVEYLQVILQRDDFAQDPASVYCLRGILAILTNCLPTDSWLQIINRALANDRDEEARKENPFRRELFVLIIERLLASPVLRKQAIVSEPCPATLLVDIALIFLNKWSDASENLNADNGDAEAPQPEPNQVLSLLRADIKYTGGLMMSEIIAPYIDAKYDRLRLMTLATLSSIMDYNDFEQLQIGKPSMVRDIIQLLFGFINRAYAHPEHQFKGISFDRLLRYLHRFLSQDVVKEQAIGFVPKLVDFASNRQWYALKILQRIASSPKVKPDLLKNEVFQKFFNHDADILYANDQSVKQVIGQIRQDLNWKQTGEPSTPVAGGGDQVFISYCHRDKEQCQVVVKILKEGKLFAKIWVDTESMQGNLTDNITTAIKQSVAVFVLLSESYCQSDMCRPEWEFAREKKIKVYSVVVQQDFKRGAYDWVQFYIGSNYYYRLHIEGEMKKLINNIRSTQNTVPLQQSSRPPPLSPVQPSNQSILATAASTTEEKNYLKKRSVTDWTEEDVQEWCQDKNLEKWSPFLVHYHGPALLELRRVLAVESHLPHFLSVDGITVFNLVLFKCELNRIVAQLPPRRRISARRHRKRTPSVKSSSK